MDQHIFNQINMKQKDILFLLISSTFLAIVWIVFTIIHTSLTSTISSSINQQIQPIEGTFDSKTLQVLQKRTAVTPQTQIQATDITPTPTPSPTPIPTASPLNLQSQEQLPNLTPTIVVSPTQSASSSGGTQ